MKKRMTVLMAYTIVVDTSQISRYMEIRETLERSLDELFPGAEEELAALGITIEKIESESVDNVEKVGESEEPINQEDELVG